MLLSFTSSNKSSAAPVENTELPTFAKPTASQLIKDSLADSEAAVIKDLNKVSEKVFFSKKCCTPNMSEPSCT